MTVQDTIQQTARAVTSKPVQRAVVNTVLLACSAVSLFAVAAVATALFFQSFMPDRELSKPVHLQYGSGINPWGLVSLADPVLKSQQEYDISVTLAMPRSTPNTERGNFMIAIHLLDSPVDRTLDDDAAVFASSHESFGLTRSVIFSSRRPALVPYVDPVVALTTRVLFLFWHMLFPCSHTLMLAVPLAEKVSFPRMSGPPQSAYVEVEAGQTIQIYSAELTLTAQLSGLRYLMFHYRTAAYITSTVLFWICEVLFMGAAFAVFGPLRTSSGSDGKGNALTKLPLRELKHDPQTETSEYSEHSHTFPGASREAQVKSEPRIKQEDDDAETERLLSEMPGGGAEADDEAEGEMIPPAYASGKHSEPGNLRKRSSQGLRE